MYVCITRQMLTALLGEPEDSQECSKNDRLGLGGISILVLNISHRKRDITIYRIWQNLRVGKLSQILQSITNIFP